MGESIEPFIDIVIPAFNAATYIEETLEAVFQQTCSNFMVYVVNDGSTDDTEKVLNKYASERFIVLNQQNSGPSKSRNTGYAAGQGKYVVFLDADDLWEPDFLERTVGFLERNPKIGLIFSDFSTFNAAGPLRERWSKEDGRVYQIPSERDADGTVIFTRKIWPDLLTGSFVPMGGAVLRREAVERTGPFDPELGNGEDREFFIRLTYENDAAFIDASLFHYRIHQKSISRANLRKVTDARTLVGEKLLNNYDLDDEQRQRIKKNLAEQWSGVGREYLRSNDRHLAIESFRKSFSFVPNSASLVGLALGLTNTYPALKWLKEKVGS